MSSTFGALSAILIFFVCLSLTVFAQGAEFRTGTFASFRRIQLRVMMSAGHFVFVAADRKPLRLVDQKKCADSFAPASGVVFARCMK